MARSTLFLRHSRQVSQTTSASKIVRVLCSNVGSRTMRYSLVEDEEQQRKPNVRPQHRQVPVGFGSDDDATAGSGAR